MNIKDISMNKIIAVANKTYQYTVIEVGVGLFAKINPDKYHLYAINFVGPDGKEVTPKGVLSSKDAEARLSGTFTSYQKAIRALRDFCKENSLPIKIQHVSTTGEVLSVNPEAI